MTQATARAASTAATLAGISGILYSVAFVAVAANLAPGIGLGPSWVILMIGSLLAGFATATVYVRVRDVDPTVAVASLIAGGVGAAGAVLHAGYEIGLSFHPAANVPSDLPAQVDPRGLATFGLTGLALLGISWLMRRSGAFPSGLATLGYVSGGLLILIWLARLTILTPTNPVVLLVAAVEGLIVNPVWYIWLGRSLAQRA